MILTYESLTGVVWAAATELNSKEGDALSGRRRLDPPVATRMRGSQRDASSTVELEAIERDACSPDSFRSRSSKGSPIDPNQRMLALVESFRKIEATDRTDRSGGQRFKRRAAKGASSMRSV